MYKKNLVVLLIVISVFISVSGCGAFFGNETQYERGDWYGLSNSQEVARIKQDKLALKKLRQQTPKKQTGNQMGYKGMIHNFYHSPVNFVIRGPEERSFLLKPNQTLRSVYLVPGKYYVVFYSGGEKIGHWTFHSDLELDNFMGEKVHWYLYCGKR